MNKKILFMALMLAVAMLSSSIMGVFAAKKTTTSYLLAATFNDEEGPDRYWGIGIPGGQDVPKKWFNKQFENMIMVTLNIGGSLVEIVSGPPPIYAMVGGTTYVFDALNPEESNITYQALQFMKGDNVNPDAESPDDLVFSWIHPTVWTTITFLPESGIEGTIVYKLEIEYLFDPPGVFVGFTLSLKGHGTGDLNGAIFNAVGGPLILHGACVSIATHEGTVRGWPTP